MNAQGKIVWSILILSCATWSLLVIAVVGFIPSRATRAQQVSQKLSEEGLIKLVELQIDDDSIVEKIKKDGLSFAITEATTNRLKKLGVSAPVIAALVNTRDNVAAVSKQTISYYDILKLYRLGVTEAAVLKRLEKSPTQFILDAEQVDELRKLGASDAVINAMRKGTAKAATAASAKSTKVTDFAIVLDCSGSMSERTPDGQSKMEEAKRVVSALVNKLPEKLRVAFIIYGYDRNLNCEAVKVARELGELDGAAKSELQSQIAALQPVGGTPIARALEFTGKELAKNDAPCGMVLISDGKETCGGNPAEVAASLRARLNMTFGVNVIGFDVKGDERASLEDVARAGKGKYYNAENAAELNKVFLSVSKELEQSVDAPEGGHVAVATSRTVKVLPSTIKLPALDEIYLTPVGTVRMALRVDNVARTKRYNVAMRIPRANKLETFDLWWSPERGRAVRMVKDLSVTEPAVEVQPAAYLGLIRIKGANLPKASLVMVTPVGTASFATRAESIQSAESYGVDMVVPAGTYDLWIEPSDGGKSEQVVEKLEVVAGKVTVIE